MLIFSSWERNTNYEQNVDSNAIKFENNNLISVVNFNSNDIAEGVSFLSQDVSDETGETSYVNINYDKLIKWATGNKTETIENNRTSEYPIDVFIGNQHDYLMNPQ